MTKNKLSTNEIIKEIHKRFDYSLSNEERVEVIEQLNIEFGDILQDYYAYYRASNLKDYNNRTVYDKLCSLFDRMSEYVLFSDHELDDTTCDESGLTAKDRKSVYTFSQESNLKTMQSKDHISIDSYVHVMTNAEEMQKIKYDDQNHAIYTLKDFESRMSECPHVEDYMTFNKGAREIIEILDKQMEDYLEQNIPTKDMPELTYTNKKGKTYEYTTKHLAAIKRGIGYNKNNSMEIDKDIMTIYREWFKPIFFNSVTRCSERTRKLDLDFMDKTHMSGLIKASCLVGQFGEFDSYVKKLDELTEQSNLTELEMQVYQTLRRGKGLDLDNVKYEDNMVTISECARLINRSQSKVDTAFNSLVDKIMDKYEEIYEDYYFTYIARGTYKTCSKCGEVKLANERYFKWDKTNKRFKSMCKRCENEIQREYRQKKDF